MRIFGTTAATALFVFFLIGVASAIMPPAPGIIEEWKAAGIYEERIQQWRAFKAAEAERQPDTENSLRLSGRSYPGVAQGEPTDTFRVPVILVEFTDHLAQDQNYSATPDEFRTMIFSRTGVDSVTFPDGSMTEFYLENSYGNVLITGEVYGWYMMPRQYSYYSFQSGLTGRGAELAADAIVAADPDIDYTEYTNGDQQVDGVIVVHAGPGAEASSADNIWSHVSVVPAMTLDGVSFRKYSQNPEEFGSGFTTMGVFGHEFGHILDLPDLYDIGGGSGNGLDRWSMMASGSWNGFPSGSRPAHFDAWCKMDLGYVQPVWLTENMGNVELPAAEHNPVVYALGSVPNNSTYDYWLVENRQSMGFDASLPGSGLALFHVEPAKGGSQTPNPYFVALEQADGQFDLEIQGSSDAGDPYPGSTNNREFHPFSLPNSNTTEGAKTTVAVWVKTASDSVMYADLDVIEYSRPYMAFDTISDSMTISDEDGDGIPEAGELVEFEFQLINKLRPVFSPRFSLTTDAPGVEWVTQEVSAGTGFNQFSKAENYGDPIVMRLPADFQSYKAQFTLTVTADSAFGSTERQYTEEFSFNLDLGRAQIMLIDDDNGEPGESRYTQSLDRLKRPYDYFNVNVSGTPLNAILQNYSMLIWFTGSGASGGDLNAAEIAVIETYLDGGGNLWLSSMGAGAHLQATDSAFMHDYLHATLAGTGQFAFGYPGLPGTYLDGTKYGILGTAPINPAFDELAPVGGSVSLLGLSQNDITFADTSGIGGVAYADGNYRSVFTTVGFEFIGPGNSGIGVAPEDTLMARTLDFLFTGTATPVDEDGTSTELLPVGFTLSQNYPNPFNPSTTIQYSVPGDPLSRGGVRTVLKVYNALGQEVRTLVDAEQSPGNYEVVWDGRTDAGTPAATGIYLYRLEVGEKAVTKKMVLLK